MSPTDDSGRPHPHRPALRVIRGDASAEEIAALLAVVMARSRRPAPGTAAGTAAGERPISVWSDRARALRRPLYPGPGAWAASGWQR